jgi:hypothetical protein
MNTVTHIRQDRPTPHVFDCEGVGFDEILQLTGITYRQLDYWTASGRIKAHWHKGGKVFSKPAGSGSVAHWMPDQVAIIGRVAALLRCGFELVHAFQLATDLQAVSGVLAELTYIQADLMEEEER